MSLRVQVRSRWSGGSRLLSHMTDHLDASNFLAVEALPTLLHVSLSCLVVFVLLRNVNLAIFKLVLSWVASLLT